MTIMNAALSTDGSVTPRKRSMSDEEDRVTDKSLPTNVTSKDDGNTVDGSGGARKASDSPKPAKKRKLTVAEREEQQKGREAKEREKAEKKAKVEEEKRVKEEERRQREAEKLRREEEREAEKRKKAAERDEKQRLKEAEKKAKEDKKREIDEEKARKERAAQAQTRLNAFFKGPQESSEKAAAKGLQTADGVTAPSSVLAGAIPGNITPGQGSPQKPTRQSGNPDYERDFQPFFIKPHVLLAPVNRFAEVRNLPAVRKEIEDSLQASKTMTGQDSSNGVASMQETWLARLKKVQWARYRSFPRVKDLLRELHGSAERPVDLTSSIQTGTTQTPLDILSTIPIKYLQFAEDVRPAYRGTFTREPATKSALRLGKNPFQRSLPDTDYDYDSEAEWVEPEEGEDLDSEGEEEIGSEEEGDDMEGFLDDEGLDGAPDAGNKRRILNDDLRPVCTGLCWEDVHGKSQASDNSGTKSDLDLKNFRMQVLLDSPQLPIDPYTASYWSTSSATKSSSSAKNDAAKLAARSDVHPMDPPRLPLNTIYRANGAVSKPSLFDSMANTTNGSVGVSKEKKRIIAPEYLEDFKMAVQGSDLTKTGLIEVLKKRFPKASKDIIKDTLTAVASRVGTKEADKRWKLLDAA